MTTFLTNDIDPNSFMGLVTNRQHKVSRRIFVKVESWAVLRNLAMATTLIIIGLTAGAISQKNMEFVQYDTPVTRAAV